MKARRVLAGANWPAFSDFMGGNRTLFCLATDRLVGTSCAVGRDLRFRLFEGNRVGLGSRCRLFLDVDERVGVPDALGWVACVFCGLDRRSLAFGTRSSGGTAGDPLGGGSGPLHPHLAHPAGFSCGSGRGPGPFGPGPGDGPHPDPLGRGPPRAPPPTRWIWPEAKPYSFDA